LKTDEKSRKGVVVLFLLLEIVFAFPLKLKKKKFKRLTFFEINERGSPSGALLYTCDELLKS